MRRTPLVGIVAAVLLATAIPATASPYPSNPDEGATANPHPPTSGRCAAATTRSITGSLLGADGLAFNATVAVDVLDSAGHHIDVSTGCRNSGGYGAILQLNHWTSSHGAPVGSAAVDAQGKSHGTVSPVFRVLHLPANATQFFVDSYTRDYTGSPCGLPCAGPLDRSKYSLVNERNLTYGQVKTIKLVAPLHSSTGQLKLTFNRSDIKTVWIFNFNKRGPSNGWDIAGPVGGSSGNARTWLAPSVPAGPHYITLVTFSNGKRELLPHGYGKKGFAVTAGKTRSYSVAV